MAVMAQKTKLSSNVHAHLVKKKLLQAKVMRVLHHHLLTEVCKLLIVVLNTDGSCVKSDRFILRHHPRIL
jgi:hypothetical protein